MMGTSKKNNARPNPDFIHRHQPNVLPRSIRKEPRMAITAVPLHENMKTYTMKQACELTGISLDAFVGEAKYDIGMAMYKLNEHYQDKFSLYVYFNDELKSLDEWIRETDLSGSFYFGGTLDYHY